MSDHTYDVLISGGGIAGLVAAVAFGSAGFSVICVDPAPPVTTMDQANADLRTTAFLQPSRAFLDQIGLWPAFAPHAAELAIMRIVDAGGTEGEARLIRDFDSADISDLPFGWNLPNWLLSRELLRQINDLATVDFRAGTGTTTLFTRIGEARVGLSDGSRIRCKLVIAADGRASPMREAAGIDVKTTRFGQKALAFAVTHPIPHQNISTEIHRSGGPFTLVPLPDRDGMPCSAVVWMEDGPTAQDLAALEVAAFEEALNLRSCLLYGPLKLASRRTVWPIIAQHAQALTGQRLALVAEAAHVLPPIGAQGLNMSLADIATLRELAIATPDQIGSADMLAKFEATRLPDIRLRIAGITALNRASMQGSQAFMDLRAAGLQTLYGIPGLRKSIMQLGLGLASKPA